MTPPARACRALVLILLGATAARANQSTGTVSIAIAAPGVDAAAITLSSEDEPGRNWSARAAPGSPASVSGLPAGRYRVEATAAGGAAATIDVDLDVAEVITLHVQTGPVMPLRFLLVDRHDASQGVTISDRQLRELPDGSGVWSLLDTAAPLVITDRMDTGGLSLGTPSRAGSRGAPWARTAISLAGLDLARGEGGPDQTVLVPDLATLDAVRITAGFATAAAATPGVSIALVPRRPGPQRRSAFDVSFTAPGMVASNDRPAAPSIAKVDSWAGAALQSGGALRPRTGIFLAASASHLRGQERADPALIPAGVVSGFAHLVANPGERTQARIIGSVQRVTRPSSTWPIRTAALSERDVFVHVQGAFERHTRAGARIEIAAGVQRGDFTPTGAIVSHLAIDRVTEGPVPRMRTDTTVSRPDVRVVFAPASIRAHALEFGASVAGTMTSHPAAQGPDVTELISGLPVRVWIPRANASASARRATHVAVYADDRFQVRPDLTVNLGLRVVSTRGSAEGAEGSIGWHGVLPRASVRWASKVLTVFGGYGRYMDELPMGLLAFGDPGEPVYDVYRADDRTLVALGGRGPAVASIDPSLGSPHTDEFVLGAERRFGTRVLLTGSAVIRHERSIPRSVNVGVPRAGYQVRQLADQGEDWDGAEDDRLLAVYDRLPASFGQDRFLLTNVDGDHGSYEGIEISTRWASTRWWSEAGVSASRSEAQASHPGFRSDENDQGVMGALFENPNANTYPLGRLFFDRAYVLKWTGGYRAPHDILASFAARYQDGQPFSRLVIANGLAQGPELVSAYFNGRTRFTFTATIDARFEKGFTINGQRAAIRFDLYNLTNLGNEVEEDALTGPDFRRTTAVQPPLTVRVGFRVEF